MSLEESNLARELADARRLLRFYRTLDVVKSVVLPGLAAITSIGLALTYSVGRPSEEPSILKAIPIALIFLNGVVVMCSPHIDSYVRMPQ